MHTLPNPFATCYTAPGRLPFLGRAADRPAADLLTDLHARWLQHERIGAIVGPHGAGKSTLLAALDRNWSERFGVQVTRLTLRFGERVLPRELWSRELGAKDLLIVDGYEQLGWFARCRLRRLRHRTCCGLLVTTHDAVRLPVLYRVEPCYETLLDVVRRLLVPWQATCDIERFIVQHVRNAWQTANHNARETLFRLYDCWEADEAKPIPLAPGQ